MAWLQVDEYLHSLNKEKIFSRLFEGAFSDQKICCGCPHRYEREEKFMSLNLDVKPGSLQESLRQQDMRSHTCLWSEKVYAL